MSPKMEAIKTLFDKANLRVVKVRNQQNNLGISALFLLTVALEMYGLRIEEGDQL